MSRSCATGSGTWLDHLPFVLLGMRTAIRSDSDCSPSDLLYGSPLRLPGDMFFPSEPPPMPSDFAGRLRVVLGSASPLPIVHHGVPVSRVDPGLRSASHVFLRIDAVKKPLVPPYLGPFRVLGRSDDLKTFDILQHQKKVTVSVDRLKPAHVLPAAAVSPPSGLPPSSPRPPAQSSGLSSPCLDPESWPLPTRYGRRPRPPARLNL